MALVILRLPALTLPNSPLPLGISTLQCDSVFQSPALTSMLGLSEDRVQLKFMVYNYLLCDCVHAQSVVSDSATPWTIACQAPLSMGFSRLEYWSCHFLLQGVFPTPGIEHASPALAGRFFTTGATWEALSDWT